MPRYKCKDCGTIWHGWGAKESPISQKCGGKLEPVSENSTTKNEAGPPQG